MLFSFVEMFFLCKAWNCKLELQTVLCCHKMAEPSSGKGRTNDRLGLVYNGLVEVFLLL